ncbi:MAG TPA: hypothetical protein VNZ52_10745 [Candidatus Thermoplasmatota archaeon]|nr:hypothetical protein [Candidatus Thermoplasmatota archaeon]
MPAPAKPVTALVALAAATLLLAGCLEGQPAPRETGNPDTETGEVTLTLTADRDTILPNGSTVLRAVLRNGGDATLWYDGGGCGPLLIHGDRSPEGLRFSPVQPYACTADFRAVPLAPGETIQRNLTWDGRLHDGATPKAAPPGEYVFSTAVQLWSVNPIEQPAIEPSHRLEAEAPVRVEPEGRFALRFTVQPDETNLTPGNGTTFRVTATNVGQEILYYEGVYPGCGERSLQVLAEDGSPVPWSLPTPCARLYKITLESLRPGESVTWNVTWDGNLYPNGMPPATPAPAGNYTVVASEIYHGSGPQRNEAGDTRTFSDSVVVRVNAQ